MEIPTATCVDSIRDALCNRGFLVDVASRASRPLARVYSGNLRVQVEDILCLVQQVNPLSATESVASDFFIHLHTEKQLVISTIEGYRMAIASTLQATSKVEVGQNSSLKSLLQNIELEQGRCKHPFPV